VHEQPEPAAIEFLAAQLESLDVPTPPIPNAITPRTAGRLAAQMSVKVREHVARSGHGRSALMSLVLHSLKQAYYSATNIGHAGLGSESYCHFTSPIRRYPDLVVHRALLATVGGGEEQPPASELSEVASHCSQTEREAMSLERGADDVCLAFLLERELLERGWDEPLEGEISGVIPAGAFVSFPLEAGGASAEGFLPARKLRGEFFELNEESTALVGRRTGRSVRLGDPISVVVTSVEAPRGRVDVVLAPDAEDRQPHGSPRRGGHRGAAADGRPA
jgi:ribonuclease R